MKTRFSLPKDTAFFNKYAVLVHSLARFGGIAQIISGLTEIGVLYALIFSQLKDIFPTIAPTISIVGAMVTASMLQVGLRLSFPYSVRAFVYSRFKGLDLAFSIVVILLTASLLTVSALLSWHGSKDIVDTFLPPPTLSNTVKADSLLNTSSIAAQRQFTSDSATISAKFSGKIEATKATLQTQIESTERTAANAGIKAAIWSKELQAKAKILRGEMAAKLAQLESDKASEIEAISKQRNTATGEATARRNKEADNIETDNTIAKTTAKIKTAKYGGYLGFFTLFCYVFFCLSVTLDELLKKGSQIESVPLPTNYHFLPPIFDELKTAVSDRYNHWARSLIQAFADKTPSAPLPESLHSLYDFKAEPFTDTLSIVTEGASNNDVKIIKLPMRKPKIAALKTTEGGDINTSTKTRQIGFFGEKNEGETTDKNDPTASVYTASVGDKTKVCLHCSKSYIYSIHNQKYCCEDCRIAAFEVRTGRQLKKQPKK
jgi:hypothetical protein